MLFSLKPNIFFVHIPKNAGNSIRPLARKLGVKVLTHNIRRKNKRLLADYRNKRKIHAFCISRNPYDRLVSAYHYLNNKTVHREDLADKEKYVTPFVDFDDFIKNGLAQAAKEQLHFLPQVFWVRNAEGKPEVESVLRVEHLQGDFDRFCEKMKLRKFTLQVTNASKRKSWQDYYSEETKAIVQQVYRDDFEFFNYEK